MKHREIARYLHEQEGVPSWWAQMVTVGYERVRGLRVAHETADGFSVSKSKTLPVPVSQLFAAWQDETRRRQWLPEEIATRRSQPNKTLRATWVDGKTSIEVSFWSKGEEKSQVSVQHNKLADRSHAETCRRLWGQRLAALEEFLLGAG